MNLPQHKITINFEYISHGQKVRALIPDLICGPDHMATLQGIYIFKEWSWPKSIEAR